MNKLTASYSSIRTRSALFNSLNLALSGNKYINKYLDHTQVKIDEVDVSSPASSGNQTTYQL